MDSNEIATYPGWAGCLSEHLRGVLAGYASEDAARAALDAFDSWSAAQIVRTRQLIDQLKVGA